MSMGKLQKNIINKEELLADIEALKKAKTDEQVDAIMKKYDKGLAEMDRRQAKQAAKEAEKAKAKEVKEKAKAKEAEKTKAKAKEAPKKSEAKDTEKKGRYNGKYEVYAIADGYAYRLKASNGEILVTSEVYVNRDGVIRAIDTVKKNIETGEIRIFADKKSKWKFKLTSKNHRVLLISSNYAQEVGAQRASESFKKFAMKADVVDVEIKDDDAASATNIKITANEDKAGGKYEIENSDGEYSWDLKATNGEILCQAEGYTSKSGVLNAIEKFKQYVAEGTFKSVKDKTGHYQYKLYTKAGRIAAVGESYKTKTAATSAANSVVSFYKLSEIVDLEALAKQAAKEAKAKAKEEASKEKATKQEAKEE